MSYRLLVCGGRYYRNRKFAYFILDTIRKTRPISCLIHGQCPVGGADLLAEQWAEENRIPDEPYAVNRAVDGPWPGAGPRRNERMLRDSRPDGALVLPGGRGTADMLRRLRAERLTRSLDIFEITRGGVWYEL
jgi:hypothetical protein